MAGSAAASVVALALLAVLLSICSEADAFVAASLTQFPLTARLAFLVVGPAVDFPPLLKARDGAVTLQVRDFVGRAVYAPESIEDVRVRLVGLVTPEAAAPSGYLLTRFVVGCCAADAAAVQVAMADDPTPRAADTWLEVTGTHEPGDDAGGADAFSGTAPSLVADGVRRVAEPSQPYEL